MWLEADGYPSLICPVMSNSHARTLCIGPFCAAAYPIPVLAGVMWCCAFIDGPQKHPRRRSRVAP
ncbi:MAG: hypothetical protein NT074_00115 [Methanomicrobiales archaeon]|nr:hypothetical protein [Methanomicrobiales archaeon]